MSRRKRLSAWFVWYEDCDAEVFRVAIDRADAERMASDYNADDHASHVSKARAVFLRQP
jgi:hypothetical protein